MFYTLSSLPNVYLFTSIYCQFVYLRPIWSNWNPTQCARLLVGARDVIKIVSTFWRNFPNFIFQTFFYIKYIKYAWVVGPEYIWIIYYLFIPASATYEPIVNEVQVPIIRRTQCDEWLDNLTVSDGMICAGYEEGGKDACQVSSKWQSFAIKVPPSNYTIICPQKTNLFHCKYFLEYPLWTITILILTYYNRLSNCNQETHWFPNKSSWRSWKDQLNVE